MPGAGTLLAVWYLCASLACFVLYARDKRLARLGRRRIPERVLLLAGLCGGWPGGLLAQRLVRHKTAKAAFQARFLATVAANLAVLCWFWLAA